ncbi:arrestin domain-containing protein 17 [Drosophila bipectinata]|uniref:arrestin domain-containing protein 17 n=1 Tax=Drosophila bipectinata TaxID=42026 RepID=UPI001C8AAFE9|nr:arrestin domain-containing protein 17 isoform X1 [Drosophila bipectinata]
MVICEIEFCNNPRGVFYAGQLISGQVVIKVDKAKPVKAVILQIKGYAETHWTDPEFDAEEDDLSSGESFNGHVDYMATKAYLHGSGSSIEVIIEPGTSTYRFACQLPVTCPSSFEGTHGRVRYLANVRFLRPWKFDQNFSRSFTVLKVMDLNTESMMLRVPTQVESQRTYCCFPCRSAPLSIRLSLPQGGFVPGQTVPVDVIVSNDSRVAVEDITVRLAMVVIYYSQPPSADTNKDRFVMVEKTGDGVATKSRQQFTFDLEIPATPPTCFNLCSIIQIGYQVEAEARVKGCHANQSVHTPVTIGSVPLTSQLQKEPRIWGADLQLQQLDTKALVLIESHQAEELQSPPNPWEGDPSIPPPHFLEAKHILPVQQKAKKSKKKSIKISKKESTNPIEKITFTPLYAVFDLSCESDESIVRPKVKTEGGFVNEDMDRSTWL